MAKRMNWKKLLSTKRVSQFDKCSISAKPSQYEDPRHPFEKDCDQIIYSYPFRRLQDKTQVIPFPEYDFVHTRLTHSLEVSSIGRSFGKLVYPSIANELGDGYIDEQKLNSSVLGSLVGGACLAHDIGNPPFGHSGESAISHYFLSNELRFFMENIPGTSSEINELLIPRMKNDLTKFEGNANGFRIMTRNCDKGINPTSALLGTFSKYPRESFIAPNPYNSKASPKHFLKYGFFQTERDLFSELADELGLNKIDDLNKNNLAFNRHPLCYLMEASDDIAYGMIDFEDGCRLSLIDFDKNYKKIELLNKENFTEIYDIDCSPKDILISIASIDKSFELAKVENANDYKESISYLRSKVINVLIHECFSIFQSQYEAIMEGKYNGSLIEEIQTPAIVTALKKMKILIKKFVYNYPPVLQSEASGFEVMYTLIDRLAISSELCFSCGDNESERSRKMRSLLPDEFRPKHEKELSSLTNYEIYERIISVLDYVSGMTDNFAMSLYRKIKGISYK